MKYFFIFCTLVLITGCKYNPDKLKFGDKVTVIDGLYRGCEGFITDEFSWITPCQHDFYISNLTCPNATKTGAYISVCNLKLK